MKKLLSSVLASTLAVSMAFMASAAPEPTPDAPEKGSYTATQTDATITIDGTMDEAYKKAEVVKLDNVQNIGGDKYMDKLDQSATGEMRILWDDTAIYVYVMVNDSTFAPAYKDPSWWNNVDSLWLGVGVNGDLTKANCYGISRTNSNAAQYFTAFPDDTAQAQIAVVNLKGGKAVAMKDAGNAEGNYPANTQIPDGDVDGYAVEMKIPYTGAKVGGTEYFGAFISDCIDFDADFMDLMIPVVVFRARTSAAVSSDTGNGIWQRSGTPVEGNGYIVEDVSPYYDTLTFRAAPTDEGSSGDNDSDGETNVPDTGVAVSASAVVLGVSAVAALLVFRKKSR